MYSSHGTLLFLILIANGNYGVEHFCKWICNSKQKQKVRNIIMSRAASDHTVRQWVFITLIGNKLPERWNESFYSNNILYWMMAAQPGWNRIRIMVGPLWSPEELQLILAIGSILQYGYCCPLEMFALSVFMMEI